MAEEGTGLKGAALLVGIGSYLCAERVGPLRFAAGDAQALAETLLDPDICGFPRDRVMLLTDGDARRDDVVHRLSKWLVEQAKGADIAVVYFAGHGTVQRVGLREEGFLLPYDADPEDLVTRGVAMSDGARWIEGIEAGAVVVCLDCCHAGKVVTHRETVPELSPRDMRLRPTVLQGLAGKRRYLIASCDEGQTSVEAEQWGHGLFTYHLLKGLKGAGDRDGDGKVGVAELFEYVAAAVERDARKFGTEQKPWYSAIGPGGVYLATPRKHPCEPGDAEEHDALIRKIEDALAAADVPTVLANLSFLVRLRRPAALPTLFQCLTHRSAEVRQRAQQGIQSLGWERVAADVEDLARRGEVGRFSGVLAGLAAFESHREVVALLDRLVTVLKGDLRNRAILLLERKRLSLELERTEQIFREIQSPYKILRVLGQGLFTAAFLARDEMSELDVVVRVLRPEFAAQPHLRARFLDLSKQSVRYVHHNLVLTREFKRFPDRNLYYTVRDHVDGVTLQKRLESGKRFSPTEIVSILRQLLEALTPIHARRGLHGGIKPSNIFLGPEDRVVLGDVSLPLQEVGMTLDRLSYDYRYAPPEMFRGGGVIGPPSDFYALGCVAYELACGHPPFVADNPYELAIKHDHEKVEPPSRHDSVLGRAGDGLILRLLAKSPAERFVSIKDVLRAIDDLEDEMGQQGKGYPEEPPRPGGLPSPIKPSPGLRPPARASAEIYESRVSIVGFNLGSRVGAAGVESVIEAGRPDLSETRPFAAASGESASVITTTDAGENVQDVAAGELGLPERFGRYLIQGELGQGGMGNVYRVRDAALRRELALKVLRHRFHDDPGVRSRFLVEARAIASLTHPNIVTIYEMGEEDGRIYYVLELVEGGSLSQRLDGKPMPPADAAQLVLTLARALHYAHSRGIIHRDLKPSNILLTADGIPKISDLGLAKRLDEDEAPEEDMVRTGSGIVLGTPAYMSPEQAMGRRDLIGPATDIFSLGVIFYELLTGRRPFRAASTAEILVQLLHTAPEPPSRLYAGVPRDLDAICMKCLSKEPDKRYTSAEALAQDIERFLAAEPVSAASIGLWGRVLRLFSIRR